MRIYGGVHKEVIVFMKAAKNNLRIQYRAKRKTINNINEASAQLTINFLENIKLDKVTYIAGYQPFDGEIDIIPLLKTLKALNYIIGMPVYGKQSKHLSFTKWHEKATVDKNIVFINPQLVITPLVAFASNGDRLGLGKGWYDRTILHLRPQGVKFYGVAYDIQLCASIPTNKFDQKLDLIITEKSIYNPDFFL